MNKLRLLTKLRLKISKSYIWIGTPFDSPQLILLSIHWSDKQFHFSCFEYFDYME